MRYADSGTRTLISRHLPSCCLIGRRVGEQIPVLHLVCQRRMNQLQLILVRGQKGPSTRLRGDAPQHPLPFQGDPGHAANRDRVDRRTRRLQRGQRLVDGGGTVLVVAIGNQDHRAPCRVLREAARQLHQRIQDGGATAGPNRTDGVGHGRAIVGRPGHRQQALGERRDQAPVEWRHVVGERGRRALHEVEPPRHAGAAVDEQRERRAHRLVPCLVEGLRHAVLEDAERGGRQALDEAAALVLHRGFDQNAGHLRLFDDIERLEHHAVGDLAAERIGDRHGNLAAFERILVGPLRGVWRAVAVGLQELAVDEEADWPELHARRDTWICATMRMVPDAPVRPSGDVMRTRGPAAARRACRPHRTRPAPSAATRGIQDSMANQA